jgi:glycosyltransferase involved in cell wall biosynthesis
MKDNPLVSVSIVTYNHKEYIKQCLDGVLMQQTNFDYEIILGEDESNDGTREICKDYANRFPDKIKLFLRSRKDVIYINGNPTGRFNMIKNIKACKGKYIALCEGDDYWTDPLKLQKQLDFLESNKNYSTCFHKVKILRGKDLYDDVSIEARYNKIKEPFATIDDLLEQGNFMYTPSVMFRNYNIHFPFEFEYSSVGDYFLHIINSQRGPIKRLDDVMAVYREGVGMYSSLSLLKMQEMIIVYLACIVSYLDEDAHKKIILGKLINNIESLKNQYTKHRFLSDTLSFKDVLKILALKIKSLFVK